MYQLLIMVSGILSSIMFTQMSHPLAMGLMLLIQTLLICLITGMIAPSFWFSYILFLVFLGGLLVLFIYVTSLASNEMFTLSSKAFFLMSVPMIISFMIILAVNTQGLMTDTTTGDMLNISSTLNFEEEASMFLMKLYNTNTSIITLMLVLYLFLTLIAVVTITNIFKGPLREKN
uniref:NADH dehydrogenase subunit 6 n=1 Tax=Diamphipnoa annulata TaxID=2559291 RepID=UPI0010C2C885|nr:NADH dehydrogenase subunit 6 [Diamphipnoa annulata]QBR55104.1 NADH dehydrogenase subunit 6 [Diamphipnoa annulata]